MVPLNLYLPNNVHFRYMGVVDNPPESKSSGDDILLQKLHNKAKEREELKRQGAVNTSKSLVNKKSRTGSKPSIPQADVVVDKESGDPVRKSKRKHLHAEGAGDGAQQLSLQVDKIKKKKKKSKTTVEIDSDRVQSDKTEHKDSTDYKEDDNKQTEHPAKLKAKSKKHKKKVPELSSSLQRDTDDVVSSKEIKKDRKAKLKQSDDDEDKEDRMEVDDEAVTMVIKEDEKGEEEDGIDEDRNDEDEHKEEEKEEDEEVGFTVLGEVEGKSKKKKVSVM